MTPTQLPGITADGIYTVTEKMLQKLEWQNGYQLDELRSRPHIQTPERYTGTCAMQEKCIDYADFCESIMDEITENEDEDPPCPIKCAKRVNPNQADCAEAARAATLAMLDAIFDDLEFLSSSEDKQGIVWVTLRDVQGQIDARKESLRQQAGAP